MRSDLIRMKKPVWARIVNPEPLSIFQWTHQQGDIRLMRPGGRIHVHFPRLPRSLAIYEAPCLPSDAHECPSGALLFRPFDDFRLLAEGIDDVQKCEAALSPSDRPKPAPVPIALGDRMTLAGPRRARAVPPRSSRVECVLAPYRERTEVRLGPPRRSCWGTLRRGGQLIVVETRRPRLKVLYLADPDCTEEQCENGSVFWMSEAEFHRMKAFSTALQREEEQERRLVLDILRSG